MCNFLYRLFVVLRDAFAVRRTLNFVLEILAAEESSNVREPDIYRLKEARGVEHAWKKSRRLMY